MVMVKLLVHVPPAIKTKLDALRKEGTTASGLIRHLLQNHFNQVNNRESKGR